MSCLSCTEVTFDGSSYEVSFRGMNPSRNGIELAKIIDNEKARKERAAKSVYSI